MLDTPKSVLHLSGLEQNNVDLLANGYFPSQEALQHARQTAGEDWDEEFYWVEGDARRELEIVQIDFTYRQITNYAEI
jgi:hypothetical protein